MTKIEVRHDTGYGLVPRRVMRDSGLSSTAKAVYCYLASFAGNTGRSFPSTSLMAQELNLSKNTLFKYLKELREKQVITVERERLEGNKFGKNIYYLHNKIGESINESPCRKSSDMENQYIVNQYIANEDIANCDTNSNNSNSNNINSNKSNNNIHSPETKNLSGQGESLTAKRKQLIIDKWNSLNLQNLRAINENTKRYNMLRARIKEYSFEEVIEAIERIDKSSFLKGQNQRNWTITFDWLVKPNNFLKVLEGNYDDNIPNDHTVQYEPIDLKKQEEELNNSMYDF